MSLDFQIPKRKSTKYIFFGMNMFMKYLILFLMVSKAYALPLYNPAQASILPSTVCSNPNKCFSFNGGFTGYYVRDHKLEVTNRGSDSYISSATKRTNAFYGDINWNNRIDLFCTLGTSNFSYSIPTTDLGVTGVAGNFLINTDTAFSGSVGARATLYRRGCFLIGAEGEYFRSNPHVRSIDTGGPNGMNYNYSEWQFGLGAAYRINISGPTTALMPYLGMRIGATSVDGNQDSFIDPANNRVTLVDMKQQRRAGYSIGITLIGCDKIEVSAEGAYLNETALLVNSSIRF